MLRSIKECDSQEEILEVKTEASIQISDGDNSTLLVQSLSMLD